MDEPTAGEIVRRVEALEQGGRERSELIRQNREAEAAEHVAIRAELKVGLDTIQGRLWTVLGAVAGTVIVTGIVQSVFG